MSVRVAVIYYSSTGTVHALATAVAEGAKVTGAEVRLRRVKELAPDEAVNANPAWRAHVDATSGLVQEATVEDLEWATAMAFGTPTRFGLPAAQLKQFIDQTGQLWLAGALASKAVTSFTSSQNRHGGQESTLLALNNTFYHWGSIIVPTGYTDSSVFAAGGNPYGASWATADGPTPDSNALAVAHYQGKRLASIAGRLAG